MKICFVALDDSVDTRAVAPWLQEQRVETADFTTADVIWYQAGALQPLPHVEPPDRACGLLCTGRAATLLHDWGWEPIAPRVSHQMGPETSANTNTLLGHIGRHGHPIFAGLTGGVSWQPAHDQRSTTVL